MEYTREELLLIQKLDRLYLLDKENEKCHEKINQLCREGYLCELKKCSHNMQHITTSYLFDLLNAIEKGDLVFIQKENTKIE